MKKLAWTASRSTAGKLRTSKTYALSPLGLVDGRKIGSRDLDKALLRIKQIVVRDLFGLYTHDIRLNIEDRVTIIHGPNGVGKTVLLKMVESLFCGKYVHLSKTPFSSLDISLDNGSTIRVSPSEERRPAEGEALNSTGGLLIRLTVGDEEVGRFEFDLSPDTISALLPQIDRLVPNVRRMSPDSWVDERTGEIMSSAELVLAYSDRLPETQRHKALVEPEWFLTLKSQVKVYLIETQRLLRTGPSERSMPYHLRSAVSHAVTVKQYAANLTQTMSDNLAAYGSESQILDQSFPQRLINGNVIPLSVEQLKLQLSAIEEKRNSFAAIGLIDEASQFNVAELDRLEESQRPTMTLYVADNAQKLSKLDDLSRRVTLFLDIVNAKFKNKRISISRRSGIIVETIGGHRFDLESLSSGEQHELVLTYDLLFNVGPNTFVMIDEPELSLHLYWQKAFLTDLIRIVQTTGMDVLLATHSPFIAGERTDLMVALTADVTSVDLDSEALSASVQP